MHAVQKITFMAALALCAFPEPVPAGEAAATSAAAGREAEQKLAEAQQRLDAAAREVAELSRQVGRRFNFRSSADAGTGSPRALLGVSVDNNSGREGARVVNVSPGGAAEAAGIKQGDIITGIADLDLTKDSSPGRALVEKMDQLKPDEKVKVTVLRDGRKLGFDVTPRAAPQDALVRRFDLPGLRGPGGPGGGRGEARPFGGPAGRGPGPDILRDRGGMPDLQLDIDRMFGGNDGARFGGAELASLSERLGSYFGVKNGVLVVRAGVDSAFKLQDGDVILAIDGREISSAQQAGRILRSYQPGEKLTLKIQRDRKQQNVEITAPGARRN